MNTSDQQLAQLRLLQFLSPVAPVGSYSYSQGLEWAVSESWIIDEESFRQWLVEQINSVLAEQELPLLSRLYSAVLAEDMDAVQHWSQFAIAIRDTAELRQEERDRAESYFRILKTLHTINAPYNRLMFLRSPLTSIAWFSVQNQISSQALLAAYSHNWLENSLITGIKTIPLGQSSGQSLLYELAPMLVSAIERSVHITDDNIGVSLPALSMASCAHETQYSRVYRS